METHCIFNTTIKFTSFDTPLRRAISVGFVCAAQRRVVETVAQLTENVSRLDNQSKAEKYRKQFFLLRLRIILWIILLKMRYSLFLNVSHVFEGILDEMSAYALDWKKNCLKKRVGRYFI